MQHNKFFIDDAYVPFANTRGYSDIYEYFAKQNVKMLTMEQANAINHSKLFDLLIDHGERVNFSNCLPKITNNPHSVVVAFGSFDHRNITFDGAPMSNVIEEFINKWLKSKKYLFSCDPRHFVAFEFEEFKYNYVNIAAGDGGINTHFILFDDDLDKHAVFCDEFPFIYFSERRGTNEFDVAGYDRSFWINYFDENMQEAVKLCCGDFVSMLNKTYIPRFSNYPMI